MKIRFAKKEDSARLINFARKIIDYHHQLNSYYRTSESYTDEKLAQIFEEALNNKNAVVIVAEKQNKLIGYIKGEIEAAPDYVAPHIKKIGKIDHVFIEMSYRKKGVAASLIRHIGAWFTHKKITRTELNVDIKNIDAIAVWKKLGFTDYKLRMQKNLDE